MKKISKRMNQIRESFNFKKFYDFFEAINFMKNQPSLNFVESIEVSFNLGIDVKKIDQNVSGVVILPHGTGRIIKIAVFTQGENIHTALSSGADFVGLEDLLYKIKNNQINFNVAIATPDVMNTVSLYGHILGPKGLMPNPKMGTVTKDLLKTIKNIKKGQVNFKNDKSGIVHGIIGRVDFSDSFLKNNFDEFLMVIKKNRPISLKGEYIKKIVLSTTMGIGIPIKYSD